MRTRPFTEAERRIWATLGGPGEAVLVLRAAPPLSLRDWRRAAARVAAAEELFRLRLRGAGEERFPEWEEGEEPLFAVVGPEEAAAADCPRLVLESPGEGGTARLVLPALLADTPTLLLLAGRLAQALEAEGAPAETLPYSEVAAVLAELLAGEEGRAGNRFWSRLDVPDFSRLGLPLTRREGGEAPFRPARLEAAVARGLEVAGVDRSTVLLAAWYAYLWRILRGESRVVVGLHCDGRALPELAEVAGPLARYLPLTADLTPNLTFRELVQVLQARREELFSWQESFSFARLRGGEETPYPFLFAERILPAAWSWGGGRLVPEDLHVVSEPFEVRLICEIRGERARLLWEYDRRRFEPAEMEELFAGFRTFLAEAVARPETPLRRLPLLDPEARERWVVAFNRTAAPYPRERCIHHLIEAQADRSPEAVAVSWQGRDLTYAELDRRANRLARYLQARGVGPEKLVALFLERSLELPVAFLGVLKAGGAYVPLDPDYPRDRLAFMLADTEAPWVLTVSSLRDRLPPGGAEVLCLDELGAELEALPSTRPPAAVTPRNLVYVIYTSGSTGTPKGVMITHEGLVISNQARMDYFREPVGTFLLLSPLAFDSSVVGLYWTLLTGGRLLLVPRSLQQEPGALGEVIRREGVTHLLTLPSFYELLLEHSRSEDLAGLRCAIVAGEACPRRVVEKHLRLLPAVELYSEYGATETTVWASVTDCREDRLPYVSLGRPIANATMYILDPFLAPVPVGVPGEVYFGGPALARGYWRRPEVTAERFVPDPFTEARGARLYRTGDLARRLPGGEIEFLGRVDNQVKIRGFRVELEEIEAALVAHPAVQEAAVALRTLKPPPSGALDSPAALAAALAALGPEGEALLAKVEAEDGGGA